MSAPVRIAERIRAALGEGRPLVALETTVVTHGLPHPRGVEVALALEAEVRASKAEPATIGVLDGAVRVGLAPSEIERLATTPHVSKLNLGNLAAAVSRGVTGSTTVAATMWAAHHAGLRVFATGGIGGVHRGAAESGDVSADLTALSRWPVAVVCAGAKAVLDLPRTVERLETLGVPVLGWMTDQFPAFYRRSSGLPVDARFDRIAQLARAVRAHWALEIGGGPLVVNPIPETSELSEAVYAPALERALAEAGERKLRGREVTPFLLERLREGTGERSLDANVALLRCNARIAADLAIALTEAASRDD